MARAGTRCYRYITTQSKFVKCKPTKGSISTAPYMIYIYIYIYLSYYNAQI